MPNQGLTKQGLWSVASRRRLPGGPQSGPWAPPGIQCSTRHQASLAGASGSPTTGCQDAQSITLGGDSTRSTVIPNSRYAIHRWRKCRRFRRSMDEPNHAAPNTSMAPTYMKGATGHPARSFVLSLGIDRRSSGIAARPQLRCAMGLHRPVVNLGIFPPNPKCVTCA